MQIKKDGQLKAPIHDALLAYKHKRILSFDVPGHKQGKGNKELTQFLGAECLSVDVNSMKPLDNLSHPISVIKEAEELAAKAFGATHAFFMVNGTSSAVQSMIMGTLKPGDEIIMPRNVHRSAINALILSGGVPVYINPGVDERLGISLGMPLEEVKQVIKNHPNAKAVLVNNPTYYGICPMLKEIVEFAHKHQMLVLVDEAHGTHFYFSEHLPVSAMEIGADMAAVSVHKTGGSLTQSSLLLVNNKRIDADYIRTVINITQTTSASYLLMASLDIARRNLVLTGKETFDNISKLANYAREEINKLGGYYAFGEELINGSTVGAFDVAKISINTLQIGLAGIEVYDILRDEYGIQIELGDIGNILAILSVGDNHYGIERLVAALGEIKRLYQKDPQGMLTQEYINPTILLSPKEAFYKEKQPMKLKEAVGKISGEFIMCYPPGIPILAPGEKVTKEALEYILYAKQKGSLLTGPQDMELETLQVIKGEK